MKLKKMAPNIKDFMTKTKNMELESRKRKIIKIKSRQNTIYTKMVRRLSNQLINWKSNQKKY